MFKLLGNITHTATFRKNVIKWDLYKPFDYQNTHSLQNRSLQNGSSNFWERNIEWKAILFYFQIFWLSELIVPLLYTLKNQGTGHITFKLSWNCVGIEMSIITHFSWRKQVNGSKFASNQTF